MARIFGDEKSERQGQKTRFASKRLDARLDRQRGVYINGFYGKTKRWRRNGGETDFRGAKEHGWRARPGRARHLASFPPRDSVSSKSFCDMYLFPKIMTFLKYEDFSRKLRTRNLLFIVF